jgi:NAD-dependent oxidoreductase involved in siderophore biosynthesis
MFQTSQDPVLKKEIDACENMDQRRGRRLKIPTDSETLPAHRELIKAVSTIRRCIEDLNDPIARNLEVNLASFNMNIHLEGTRHMKKSLLTDFFTTFKL